MDIGSARFYTESISTGEPNWALINQAFDRKSLVQREGIYHATVGQTTVLDSGRSVVDVLLAFSTELNRPLGISPPSNLTIGGWILAAELIGDDEFSEAVEAKKRRSR